MEISDCLGFVNVVCWSFRRKADHLKEQICACKDINGAETLAYQQQLRVCTTVAHTVRTIHACWLGLFQIVYQQVLTLDLEYALDQKVEQDLWNHGFKNNINKLQQLAKDKKVLTGGYQTLFIYFIVLSFHDSLPRLERQTQWMERTVLIVPWVRLWLLSYAFAQHMPNIWFGSTIS